MNILHTKLYKAIESLAIENLTEEDKEELLKIFMVTDNAAIRSSIALKLSDLRYHKAVPFIIKKINEKSLFNNNGTLVFSLENLETKNHFIDIVELVCTQGYEARMAAFTIIKESLKSISDEIATEALIILKRAAEEIGDVNADGYKDSPLNFIEATEDLILNRK